MGDSAHFGSLPPAETRRADRTLLSGLLAWRVSGLATGAAALVAARGRHRSEWLAAAQLAAALAESAWFARRVSGPDRWSDPIGAAVDAATAAGLLMLDRLNLSRADRVTWINWTPWSLAANVVCGQAMAGHRLPRRLIGAAAVVTAHLSDGPTVGAAVANGVAHAGFFGAARFFALEIRSSAVRLERARNAAVAQGRALARARERARQLRGLHDGAVQVLESIAAGGDLDLPSMRERAASEAERLTREAAREPESAAMLVDLLAALVDRFAAGGLAVELDARPMPELPAGVAAAMAAACGEALTNTAKHAGTQQAWVRVRADGPAVVLHALDRGRGFDPRSGHDGFGIANSIRARMADVGGAADIRSRPNGGTRVVLRWPA